MHPTPPAPAVEAAAPPPAPAERTWHRLLLAGLLLAALGGSATVVLRDERPLRFDPITNLLSAVALRQALEHRDRQAWDHWLAVTDFRPPLPGVLYQPALLLLEDQVLAIRLTDLLLFGACLLLIYRLGLRLAGPGAGLLAAALFAAFPGVVGWSRMGNADPAIWLSLLVLFRVLLDLDLRSPRAAAALGLAVGLCLGTRLLCLVFLVGPALWVLALRVRSRRSLLGLLLAAACAAGVAGFWFVRNLRYVVDNVQMSTQGSAGPASEELHPINYLRYGFDWVLVGLAACAVALAVAAVRRRKLLPGDTLLLFGLWIFAPAVQLATMWDHWERYPLAALPQCALLGAVLLQRLTSRGGWPARLRAPLWAGALAAGAVPLALPLAGRRPDTGRLRADPARYEASARALAPVPDGEPVLIFHEINLHDYGRGIVYRHRAPRVPLVAEPDAEVMYHMGPQDEVRFFLRVTARCQGEDDPACELREPYPWMEERRGQVARLRVNREADPDGVTFELYRFPRPLSGEELLDPGRFAEALREGAGRGG